MLASTDSDQQPTLTSSAESTKLEATLSWPPPRSLQSMLQVFAVFSLSESARRGCPTYPSCPVHLWLARRGCDPPCTSPFLSWRPILSWRILFIVTLEASSTTAWLGPAWRTGCAVPPTLRVLLPVHFSSSPFSCPTAKMSRCPSSHADPPGIRAFTIKAEHE